jgi:hypothetical protein
VRSQDESEATLKESHRRRPRRRSDGGIEVVATLQGGARQKEGLGNI